MSASNFGELVGRIHQELNEIKRVIDRINDIWETARRSNDDYYLDAVALNLHGFYLGFERIFVYIAETIDGSLPQGEHWHAKLLQSMAVENPNVRPAAITAEAGSKLDEYRAFRHVVRNVYAYNLDPVRLKKLISQIPALSAQLEHEILLFVAFLEDGE